jgi:hypothetical protein
VAARRVGRNRSSEGRICEPGVTACERPSKCPSKDHARKVRFVKTWSEVGTGSKAEAHLSMHYYGGIRFPRASFLSYYETWLPPSQNSHTNRSLRRPRSAVTRQRWDSRLTDPAFAGSVSPYRASSRRHEHYTLTRRNALTCNPDPPFPMPINLSNAAIQCRFSAGGIVGATDW